MRTDMAAIKYDYLGHDVLKGFDSYKYSCQDTSPLSKYVMHPFWDLVVKLCPRWVAPNLLTFVGFVCCLGHCAVCAVFDYDYTASTLSTETVPIPSWAWLLTSFLLFMAHTLDGIDGKQARRTGSSSPLGELFDHGCDAWSTVFITATFFSVFGRDLDGFSISVFRMYLIMWTVFLMFHVSHAEKYNTGILYLPWSYDFSMLGGTLLYLLTSLLGFEVFKVKLGSFTPGHMTELTFYTGSYFLALPMALYNIFVSYRTGTGKMRPFLEAIRPMISLAVAFVVATAWVFRSPNAILEKDPRAFFFALGSVYANMSCRLIVAQMTNTRCELLNYLLLPLTAAAAAALLLPMTARAELLMLYLLAVVVTAAHLHYVINVVRQMCQHLEIDCFSISQTKRRKKKS